MATIHEFEPGQNQEAINATDQWRTDELAVEGRNLSPSDVVARFRIYEYAENSDVRSRILDIAERTIPGITKVDRMLEIGCSDGMQAMANLTQRGYKVGCFTGVDLKPLHVDMGKQLIDAAGFQNIELVEGTAEDLSFIEDGTIDVVHSWYMLYETDFRKVISEVWRVLKPGGVFMLTTHGEHNISTHRNIEKLISAHSKGPLKYPVKGSYEPPKVWPRELPVKLLKEVVSKQGFETIYDERVFAPIEIPPEEKHIYKKSINTRKSEFIQILEDGSLRPGMMDEDWDWFMRHFVSPIINIQIRDHNRVEDVMDRYGGIFQKQPVSRYLLPSFYEWLPIDEDYEQS